ncbi:hypothetical protein SDC9_197455 [bioreactor metagenome]|uniref:Uncharacterized protein n=1 Tax=bioreactor metagenome TaxID=1076179 RepID=A0A645IG65_9ZZZZ
MDGGHETALDAEAVIEDLRDGGEAVRGAGGVGDDVLSGIGLAVHAEDEHRGAVLGGSGHDDFLGAGLDVGFGCYLVKKETCGFDNYVGSDFVPLEVRGIFFLCKADLFAVDDKICAFDFDIAAELTVNRVILQHVCEVIGFEKVVDSDDFDVLCEVLDCRTENHASDSSKSVNCYSYHIVLLF